jgi:hypothetical protein
MTPAILLEGTIVPGRRVRAVGTATGPGEGRKSRRRHAVIGRAKRTR